MIVALLALLLLISSTVALKFMKDACIEREEYISLLPGFDNFTVTFFYRGSVPGPLVSFQDDFQKTCYSIGIDSGNGNAVLDRTTDPTVWKFASVVVAVGEKVRINGLPGNNVPVKPCDALKAYVGCEVAANGTVRYSVNASIAHLRIFSYAVPPEKLTPLMQYTLELDKTCGLEVDNPLLKFDNFGAGSGFVRYPKNVTGNIGILEESNMPSLLTPVNPMVDCPPNVVLACNSLTCGNCSLLKQSSQRQCKLCDNLTCQPASATCSRLDSCPPATDQFCSTFFDRCTSVCGNSSIGICTCTTEAIQIRCPSPACSTAAADCRMRCAADQPVVSCDCRTQQLVGCGASLASLAPPPPPSVTPLPSPTIIAIVIGVGGGVFCICFIVVII